MTLNALEISVLGAVQRDGLCPREHDVTLRKAMIEAANYSLFAQGIKKGLYGTNVWVSVSIISSNYSNCLYDPPLLYLRQTSFHNYRFVLKILFHNREPTTSRWLLSRILPLCSSCLPARRGLLWAQARGKLQQIRAIFLFSKMITKGFAWSDLMTEMCGLSNHPRKGTVEGPDPILAGKITVSLQTST